MNTPHPKVAYIMEGPPGSGKSTIAEMLAGNIGVIHSTDNYFMVDDEYQFDPTLLAEHHQKNLAAFCQSLSEEVPIVICDNTNGKREHRRKYVRAAEKAGYWVVYVAMPHPSREILASRSKHNVPVPTIRHILRTWEWKH